MVPSWTGTANVLVCNTLGEYSPRCKRDVEDSNCQNTRRVQWRLAPGEGGIGGDQSFVSSQLRPVPTSTTSGTERVAAPSISSRTSARTDSSSGPGTSKTSSSCT